MRTEEYDMTQLVNNDNLSRKLQQRVPPNGNPH